MTNSVAEVATVLIPHLDQAMLYQEAKRLLKDSRYKGRGDCQYNDCPVYTSVGPKAKYVYMMSPDKREVLYFVKHSAFPVNGLPAARQALVWRAPNSKHDHLSVGFAQHVFLTMLLPHYGAMVTDTQQTDNGRRFWSNMLAHSLSRYHLPVYFADTATGELTRLRSLQDLTLYSSRIWGTGKEHETSHAVLAQRLLNDRAPDTLTT